MLFKVLNRLPCSSTVFVVTFFTFALVSQVCPKNFPSYANGESDENFFPLIVPAYTLLKLQMHPPLFPYNNVFYTGGVLSPVQTHPSLLQNYPLLPRRFRIPQEDRITEDRVMWKDRIKTPRKFQARFLTDSNECDHEHPSPYYKDWATCGIYHSCVPEPPKSQTPIKYTQKTYFCPGDQSFDQALGSCVDNPTCTNLAPYPDNQESLPCERDWATYVHPENCSNYYICHWTGEYYTLEHLSCNTAVDSTIEEGYFDDELKQCTNVTKHGCPNDYLPIPDGVQCTNGRMNDLHAFIGSCTKYYQCTKIDNKIKVKVMECPAGKHFNTAYRRCSNGDCSDRLPFTWKCGAVEELNVVPNNCSMYYKCSKCDEDPAEWCVSLNSCENNMIFDDSLKTCIAGPCPTIPQPLPLDWTCEEDQEVHVNPTDCTKYYQCVENCEYDDWCYTWHNCGENQTFDDSLNICVNTRCPQLPPLCPKNSTCATEGQIVNGDTDDCKMYTKCVKCPDLPDEWCCATETCGRGEFFDEQTNQCKKSEVCPKDSNLPPKTGTR